MELPSAGVKPLAAMPPGGYGIDELGEVYAVSAVRVVDTVTYIAVGESNSCQWQMIPQEAQYEFCWGNPDVEVSEPGGPDLQVRQRRRPLHLRRLDGRRGRLLGQVPIP